MVAMAQTAYNIDWLIFEGNEHLTDEWRSTMHIDLLDHWQGQGWGRKLIEAFVESVKRSGQDFGQGIWIGIAGENGKVVKFYEKLGFRIAEKPGKGESEGIQMVRDIS